MFSRPVRLPNRWIALALAVFLLLMGYAGMRGAWLKAERPSSPQTAGTTEGVIDAIVSVAEEAAPLSPDLMCFNVNSIQIPSWHAPHFLEAAKRLNPKVLRFPGGEIANYWDWQRGGIIEDDSQLPDGLPEYMRYEARNYTGGKLVDHQAGLQATNSKALFLLNMLTSDLAEQIDMLSAAAKLGIEIKYIELGNEYYFGIPNYVEKFPTPESYGETAKVWIGYLRDIFPNVKIAVFGTTAEPHSSPREVQWNQALLKTALPVADAIALHIYAEPGLDPNGFSERSYPAFDEGDFATIFGEPFKHWSAIRDFHSFQVIPTSKEIWITEFNLMEDIFGDNYHSGRRPRVMGSWGHGLYAVAMNMMFLEDSRIKMTCNHDLAEDFKFGAILPNENSFHVSNHQSFPVTPMTLSATGQALQLFSETTENMTQSKALRFSGSPQLTGKDGYVYPALYGWQFQSPALEATQSSPTASMSTSIVLNLSDRIIQLNIADMTVEKVEYRQLSADPRTLVTNESSLLQQEGNALGKITLPPHSVTRLREP